MNNLIEVTGFVLAISTQEMPQAYRIQPEWNYVKFCLKGEEKCHYFNASEFYRAQMDLVKSQGVVERDETGKPLIKLKKDKK